MQAGAEPNIVKVQVQPHQKEGRTGNTQRGGQPKTPQNSWTPKKPESKTKARKRLLHEEKVEKNKNVQRERSKRGRLAIEAAAIKINKADHPQDSRQSKSGNMPTTKSRLAKKNPNVNISTFSRWQMPRQLQSIKDGHTPDNPQTNSCIKKPKKKIQRALRKIYTGERKKKCRVKNVLQEKVTCPNQQKRYFTALLKQKGQKLVGKLHAKQQRVV